jgi:hypothetical protein
MRKKHVLLILLGASCVQSSATKTDGPSGAVLSLPDANASPPAAIPSLPWSFKDVSAESGIAGPVAALGNRSWDVEARDLDGDHRVDVIVADHIDALHMGHGRLFQNKGGFLFSDFTATAFTGLAQQAGDNVQDVLAGDLDGDGRIDIIASSNDGVGWAYRGDAPLHFAGLTSLVVGAAPDVGWNGHVIGRGIAYGDIDNDGDLDIFLSNHGSAPRLLRNDGGSWTDITSTLPINLFSSIQPYFADFDGDGNLDLMVTVMIAYTMPAWPPALPATAHLLHGNGNGTFTDVSASSHIADLAYINGPIAVGDLDGDSSLDVFQIGMPHDPKTHQWVAGVTHTFPKLLLNDGHGVFSDATARASGLGGPFAGDDGRFWDKGTTDDFNHDGRTDVFIVRGGPHFYRNLGGLAFALDTSAQWSFASQAGPALADLDGDGDVDAVVLAPVNSNQGVKVFRNEQNDSAWLLVDLNGPGKNTFGVGATVRVYDAGHIDDVTHLRGTRQMIASSNHHVSNTLHFGVPAGQSYDVRVVWHAGSVGQALAVPAATRIAITAP